MAGSQSQGNSAGEPGVEDLRRLKKSGGKHVSSSASCNRRLDASGRKLDKNVLSVSGCSGKRMLRTANGETELAPLRKLANKEEVNSGSSGNGMGSGARQLSGKKKSGGENKSGGKTKSGSKGGGKHVASSASCKRRLVSSGRKLSKSMVSISGCNGKRMLRL